MKSATDLIYRLGRSIPGAILDGTEAELQIPSLLVPTIAIPGPMSRYAGFSITATQRESFLATGGLAMAASTADSASNIVTLGRGLWRLLVIFSFIANYTQAFDVGGSTGRLRLFDTAPTTASQILINAFAVTNVAQNFVLPFDLLLPDDGWVFDVFGIGTGVGQTQHLRASILGSRLH